MEDFKKGSSSRYLCFVSNAVILTNIEKKKKVVEIDDDDLEDMFSEEYKKPEPEPQTFNEAIQFKVDESNMWGFVKKDSFLLLDRQHL